jgi:hypothetical protein
MITCVQPGLVNGDSLLYCLVFSWQFSPAKSRLGLMMYKKGGVEVFWLFLLWFFLHFFEVGFGFGSSQFLHCFVDLAQGFIQVFNCFHVAQYHACPNERLKGSSNVFFHGCFHLQKRRVCSLLCVNVVLRRTRRKS